MRHPLWGFSYALYPYLTAIISSVFMAITSLFTKSAAALLTAARLTSVLSGTGTLIVVFLIGEELFERRESALLGGIFVGFLPQFVFLSCYVNNDFVRRFIGRTDHLFLDSRHEKRILQKETVSALEQAADSARCRTITPTRTCCAAFCCSSR